MSKVTGKFQITLPKRLAETYGVRVGDDVQFVAAGERIALVCAPREKSASTLGPRERLRYFDRATERQRKREGTRELTSQFDRGWTREELYTRGRPR